MWSLKSKDVQVKVGLPVPNSRTDTRSYNITDDIFMDRRLGTLDSKLQLSQMSRMRPKGGQ